MVLSTALLPTLCDLQLRIPQGEWFTKIVGIEGISPDRLQFEIQRGAKLVCYQYCVSLVVITLRRSTSVYYVPAGENAVAKGLPWILLSMVAGWWGIPWGPIFTIQSLITNFRGGKDVTATFSQFRPAPAVPVMAAKA